MPLGAPIIQLQPPGLLDLLGIQSTGKTPPGLGEVVTPTFDLQSWYLRAKREAQTKTTVLTTGSNVSADYTVPNGEWWYVWNFAHYISLAAADLLSLAVSINFINAKAVALNPVRRLAVTAALQEEFLYVADPFWAAPGDILGLFSNGTFAGVSSQSARVVFSRLRV